MNTKNKKEIQEQNIVIIHYAGNKLQDTYCITYDKYKMKYYKNSVLKI